MIHLTTHKRVKMKNGEMGTNKMDGFTSINVSVKRNPFCQGMQKCEGKVCQHCYAKKIYKTVENCISRNTDIMTADNFQPEFIGRQIVRLHSFGELYSEKHLENIVALIKFNPHCLFTLWTKRANIVKAVMDRLEKPVNLILIYSSHEINMQEELPLYFNKVFTVYEKIAGVDFNCQKLCAACMKCYNTKDRTVYINEELK